MNEQRLILSIEGQIIKCFTPQATDLYCKFGYSYGSGWSLASGPNEGITQQSKLDSNNSCVWNYPINVSFKAERPFGWPQIVMAIYGKNSFGLDMVVGYGAVHFPTTQGSHLIDVSLFTPASTSIMQKIIGFITGSSPEFINLNFIAGGEAREVTKTESQGKVQLSINVIFGGLESLDLNTETTNKN